MTEPLTKPQRGFLLAAAAPTGIKARDDYPPVIKLKELGFIESTGAMVNWKKTWVVTDGGRARVQKLRTRRRKVA